MHICIYIARLALDQGRRWDIVPATTGSHVEGGMAQQQQATVHNGGPFETRVYGGGECREAQVDCETGVSASISLPRQLKVLNSHA